MSSSKNQTFKKFNSFFFHGEEYFTDTATSVYETVFKVIVDKNEIKKEDLPFHPGNWQTPMIDTKPIFINLKGEQIPKYKEYKGFYLFNHGSGQQQLDRAELLSMKFSSLKDLKINYIDGDFLRFSIWYENNVTYKEKEDEIMDQARRYIESGDVKDLGNLYTKIITNQRKTKYSLDQVIEMIIYEEGSRPQFIKLGNSINRKLLYEFLRSQNEDFIFLEKIPYKSSCSVKAIATKDDNIYMGKHYKTGGRYKKVMMADVKSLYDSMDSLPANKNYYFLAAFDVSSEYEYFIKYSQELNFPENFHFMHFNDCGKI